MAQSSRKLENGFGHLEDVRLNDVKLNPAIDENLNLSNGNGHSGIVKVLVTGGAGYIGSVLVPMLLEKGYEVTVLDIFLHGVTSMLAHLKNPNLKIIKGDIREEQTVSAAMESMDAVIHLAAIVGYTACQNNPKLTEEVNVIGTRNILNCLQPDQKIIYSSTGSSYGNVDGLCTEETKLTPLTLYARTKAQGEQMVLQSGGASLRLATLFGVSPRMRLDLLVNDLTLTAVVDKQFHLFQASFRRTFLHVRDAAKAFILALEKYEVMKGRTFNVGDESLNLTKGELSNRIQKFASCTIIAGKGEDKDNRDYEVSYTKIQKLGFRAKITLEDGIKELVHILPMMSTAEILQSRNT